MPGKIAALSALGVAALAAAFFLVRSPADAPQTRGPASLPASAATLSGDDQRLFRPEAGFRYIYGFKRTIDFEGDLSGAHLPHIGYGGELYVDVRRADAKSFDAVVSERIEGVPALRAPLARITAAAGGDSLSVQRAGGISEDERQHLSVVKDLVALWLFPLRTDTAGDFEARFEPLPAEPGFARERKVKLAYRSHAANTPTILKSEHELLWDLALHLPKEVSGQDRTRLGNGKSTLVADSRYRLLYRAREKAPADAALAGAPEADSLALGSSARTPLADHPEYKNLDWGKILSEIRGIGGLTEMKQLGVFGDALKFLRLHPERVVDLSGMLLNPALLSAGPGSAEFRTLVGALASTGGADAFSALVEAYQSPSLTDDGRQTILAALTTTQAQIDSATREFLAQTMQSSPNSPLGDAAGFALGASLHNAANDAQSASAISTIESRFAAAAGSEGPEMSVLDIMGNSGRSEFLPSIESVLQQGTASDMVQAKAEYALRFINSPSATQYLLQGMSSNDAVIRGAAAAAIGAASWSESYRASLTTCAASDPVAQIQNACKATLAAHSQVASN